MKTRMAVIVAGVAMACIIPDRDITFEGGPENVSAVRILERTPLPLEMREICNAEDEIADLTFCPPVRRSLPSGLIRSDDDGPFCICPSGTDLRAIEAFTIYAEDGDLDGDEPLDTLYGVFVLDPDPRSEEPNAAYDSYRPFGDEGQPIPVTDLGLEADRTAPGEARDTAPQWAFRIDDGSGVVDLCNGDDVGPGMHNLQFLVTDRPWFEAPYADESGSVRQHGVPDVAAGASYATANYIFECIDALDEEDARSGQCECE